MFTSRFFRPAIRAASRTYTTARSRTPLSVQQPPWRPSRFSFKKPSTQWQTTFRQAQTRQYAYSYRRFGGGGKRPNILMRWVQRPTFYYEVGGIGMLCGGYYVANLEAVPVSGRMRFNVVSPETEKQLGQQMYQQVMQEYGNKILPANSKEHRMVDRVLQRLIPHSGVAGEEWEVHVIDDAQKNAFVIPGGKVFVFSGILETCQDDNGLATVLGHEIAHNVAHHSAEKMSQSVILLPVGLIAFVLTGFDPTSVRIFQVGTSLAFELPGSRKQEEEADYIGLLMMSEACYDPSAAIGFWGRMEKAAGNQPPQFLSTHPSNHNRLEKIRSWLPEAQDKVESSDCQSTIGFANEFRKSVDFQRW